MARARATLLWRTENLDVNYWNWIGRASLGGVGIQQKGRLVTVVETWVGSDSVVCPNNNG